VACADFSDINSVGEGNSFGSGSIADPAGPCPSCGSGQYRQLPSEPWHCRACEPDMPLAAATLALPCHKVQHQPVRDPARVKRMVEDACRGLSITPEQLRRELKIGGDLADLESGALTKHGLRLTAETLALMRYST
jgi:hypothetical protein